MTNEPLLIVKDLVKHFPIYSGVIRKEVGAIKAVDGISFHVNPGEIVGIVGESGSGKSTAARATIHLLKPTSGSIIFDGQDLNDWNLKKLRLEVQMVFQDPYASLNPRKTIFINIGEALQYHQIVKTKEELYERCLSVLSMIGLGKEALDRYPHEFSGGQQQRICIGRAIALSPKLIVCDEAVSSLDVSIQAQILNLLYKLKQDLGLSYLFISHDLNVVHHFCDRVLVMFKGKIVEEGSVQTVFSNPQHPYTQRLLASR